VQVVEHVRKVKGGHCRLFAVGFSAGSNCLTKYVGEKGTHCKLAAAASVANGFDIRKGLVYIKHHARLLDRCALHHHRLQCMPLCVAMCGWPRKTTRAPTYATRHTCLLTCSDPMREQLRTTRRPCVRSACPTSTSVSDLPTTLELVLCRMITYNLQNLYERCAPDVDKHSPIEVQRQKVLKCHSVRDIDTVITAQVPV
jgi:predicted alpha/beta-fold hydrolase